MVKGCLAAGIAAALSLVGAAEAQARDWIVLGGSNKAFVGIDRSSITRTGNTATAWSYLALYDPATSHDPEADYFMSRVVYECGAYRARTLFVASFDAEGGRLRSEAPDRPETDYVVPDTLDAFVYERACNGSSENEIERGAANALLSVMVERLVTDAIAASEDTGAAAMADEAAARAAAADTATDAAETNDPEAARLDAAYATGEMASPYDSEDELPPCPEDAAECDPWEREWPAGGSVVAPGTIVTRDGRVTPPAEPRRPN